MLYNYFSFKCYTHRFLGWKIRVVDSCDSSGDNRKALNVRPPPPAHKAVNQPPSSRTVNDEGDLDYYDELPPRPSHTVPQLKPEHRSPDVDNDESHFGEEQFGSGPNFPSEFDDFIKNQSFGKQEETPSNRPRPNSPVAPARPNPSHRNPSEIQPHIITAQPNDHSSLDQLNKLVNQASPLGQKLPTNVRNPPPRKQTAIERPIQTAADFNRRQPQQSHQEPQGESINRPVTGNRFLNQNQRVSGTVVGQQGNRHFNPTVSDRQSFQAYGKPIKNEGFNPGTVILESGFKPIRKSDGPIPPLGFEVEEPSAHERDSIFAADHHHNHNFNLEIPTDRPSLITLDPVFIASDPDIHVGRPKNSAPITLPKAVVPVVPGPAQIIARYPPIDRPSHQQQQQHQQQNQQPPQFRQIPVQLHQRPPVQTSAQGTNQQETPQRKQRPGFANFFGFGSQRRQQQAPSSPTR